MDVLDRVMAAGSFNIKAITLCCTTLIAATGETLNLINHFLPALR